MLPTAPRDPYADAEEFAARYYSQAEPQGDAPPPEPSAPAATLSADPYADAEAFAASYYGGSDSFLPAPVPGVAEGIEAATPYGEGSRSYPTFGEQAGSVGRAMVTAGQNLLGGTGTYLQKLADAGEQPGLRLPIPAEVLSVPMRAVGETLERGQEQYMTNALPENMLAAQIAQDRPVVGFAQDVAAQVPQLGLLGGLGGPAGLSALGISAAGSEIQEAEWAGASPGQALASGTVIGGLEAATESVGKLPVVNKIVQRYIAGPEVTKGALKRVLGDVAANFGQEAAASVGGRLTQLAVYDNGNFGAKDVKNALYEGLVGAFIGGAPSAASELLQTAKRAPSERARLQAEDLRAEAAQALLNAQEQREAAAQAEAQAPPPPPIVQAEAEAPPAEAAPPPQAAPGAPVTPQAEPVPVPEVLWPPSEPQAPAPPVMTVTEEPAPPPVEVVVEAPPPPAPTVQPEPVAPTAQAAPQEAQDAQAAQADVAQPRQAAADAAPVAPEAVAQEAVLTGEEAQDAVRRQEGREEGRQGGQEVAPREPPAPVAPEAPPAPKPKAERWKVDAYKERPSMDPETGAEGPIRTEWRVRPTPPEVKEDFFKRQRTPGSYILEERTIRRGEDLGWHVLDTADRSTTLLDQIDQDAVPSSDRFKKRSEANQKERQKKQAEEEKSRAEEEARASRVEAKRRGDKAFQRMRENPKHADTIAAWEAFHEQSKTEEGQRFIKTLWQDEDFKARYYQAVTEHRIPQKAKAYREITAEYNAKFEAWKKAEGAAQAEAPVAEEKKPSRKAKKGAEALSLFAPEVKTEPEMAAEEVAPEALRWSPEGVVPEATQEDTYESRAKVAEAREKENIRIREEADAKIAILEAKIAAAESKRTPKNSDATDKKIDRWRDKIEDIEIDAEARIKPPIPVEPQAAERPAGAEDVDATKPPAPPPSNAQAAMDAKRDEVFGPIQERDMEGMTPTVQVGAHTRPGGNLPTGHRLVRLPDLVAFAKELMAPGMEVKNIPKRERKGGVLGMAHQLLRWIQLNPEMAKTPGLAEAALAHEIGHLADTFPGRRAPVWDRILRIRQALQDLGGGVAIEARKKLIESQALEVAIAWVKRSPIKLSDDTINSSYFQAPVEIYANVTGAILNDPELVQKLAPELYVEFMGRIDKDTQVADAWREIQDEVARPEEEKAIERLAEQREEEDRGIRDRLAAILKALKPENLTEIQEVLRRRTTEWLKNYWDKRSPIYAVGRYTAKKLEQAGIGKAAAHVLDTMRQAQFALEGADYYFSRVAAYFDLFNELVIGQLEAVGLTSSDFSLALRLLDQEANPNLFGSQGIRGEEATRLLNTMMSNITEEQAAALVKAQQDYWVLRSTILARYAEAGYENLPMIEKLLSNSAYARRTTLEVLQAMVEDHPKTAKEARNIEGALASALKHREGTLQGTGNALVETLLVDAALMRAAERGVATRYTVRFLREADLGTGQLIRQAKRVEPHSYAPAETGWELIRTRENGVSVGYYVPVQIAEGIQKRPGEMATQMKLFDYAVATLRAVLVTHNPAWALWNIQRDFWALYKHSTNPDPISAFIETTRFAAAAGAELGRLYLKASRGTPGTLNPLSAVYRWWTQTLPKWEQMRSVTEREAMLQGAILTVPETRTAIEEAASRIDPTQMDELQSFRAIFNLSLRKSLDSPVETVSNPKTNLWARAIMAAEHPLDTAKAALKAAPGKIATATAPMAAMGAFSERTIKIAGYRMLTHRRNVLRGKAAAGTISARQKRELDKLETPGYIARFVRTKAGTPDVMRRGAKYRTYNKWLLFSNASKEGFRSATEAAREDPAGYLLKTFTVNALPKLLTAWLVANDDDFREWYRGLPQWLRYGFTPIPAPLALGKGGESRYLPIPQDFTGAFLNGLIDVLLIQGALEKRPITTTKLAAALNPLAFYSLASVNPILETPIQGALLFGAGINPPDIYRGRQMFDPYTFDQMKDQTAKKTREFAKEAWTNLGGSLFFRPMRYWEEKAISEEQKTWDQELSQIPVLGNIVRRLYGSSFAGKREEAYEALVPARRRKAAEREARVEHISGLIRNSPGMSDREIANATYEYLIEKGFEEPTEARYILSTVRAMRERRGEKTPQEKLLDIAKTKEEEAILRERFEIPEDDED